MSVHHQNVIRSEIEAVSLFGVRSEDYIRNWLDTAHKNMRHKGFEMTDKIGGGLYFTFLYNCAITSMNHTTNVSAAIRLQK